MINPVPSLVSSKKWSHYLTAIFLCVIFIILQVALSGLVQPNHHFFNLEWYQQVGLLLHTRGLFNVWTPYPQLFAVLLSVLYSISGLVSFVLMWKILTVVTLLLIALLLWMIGKSLFPTNRAYWLVGAFLLLNVTFTSQIAFGFFNDQFDNIAVLLMLLSVYFLFRQKFLFSAVVLVVAVLLKLFPVVVLPAAIWFLRGRDRKIFLLVFMLAFLLILLPFLFINPGMFSSSLHFMWGRPAWESIFAFPHIVSRYVPTINEMSVPYAVTSSHVDLLLPIQLMVLLILAVAVWKWAPRSKLNLLFATLAYLIILLLFAKGFSSYFIIWLFPFIFLLWRPVYAFILSAGLLIVGNALYIHEKLYWVALFGRHAFLLVLMLFILRYLFGSACVQQPATSRTPLST